MTLSELQVMFQAISSSAIAGGLIYSAIQFRAYRRSQHFANFSRLVEMQMHLREMRVTDPSLAKVYRHDVEHARSGQDTDRDVREYFFNLMQLSVFEIVWFGYQQGQVPEDYFRSWESRMRDVVAEESFRRMWAAQSMKIMHDDFQSYMAGIVEKGERVA